LGKAAFNIPTFKIICAVSSETRKKQANLQLHKFNPKQPAEKFLEAS